MQAIVCHSGGMDSSICLAQAVQRFGADNVLAVAFDYGQRHKIELEQAKKICDFFAVQQRVVALDFMSHLTDNTLLRSGRIKHKNKAQPANSLVVGRNGLMLRLCAIIADNLGANFVYSGVTEVEAKYSGYRDSDQRYIDLLQNILRIDLANDDFEILTPVVGLTKAEGMQLAAKLGVLDFLLEHTISCYNGKIPGCQECPACCLRKQGIDEYYSAVN